MADANGPQAVYMAGPELVKHDDNYPQVHATAAATQQDQGWWGPPPTQQQHPGTPATTHVATSPPPPPLPPARTPQQDVYHQPQYENEKVAGSSGGRRPSWLLAAAACLLGVIIGGAIVGGVLGSMLANRPVASAGGAAAPATECRSADPARGTASPPPAAGGTSSSTSSAPPSAATTGAAAMLTNYEAANWRNVSTLASPCPRLEGQTVEAMDGSRYRVECRIDSIGRGKESPFDMKDLQSVVAYSFEDCVRSCASFNKLSPNVQGASPAMVCRTVVWRRRMDERQFFETGGNCFLKNATRADNVKGFPCDECMSGTLL